MIPIRVPCINQGQSSSNPAFYPDENTPCLICSGDVLSLKGDSHICPFTTSHINESFTVFRSGVDTKYITASERFFDIQQRKKIENSESGFLTLEC